MSSLSPGLVGMHPSLTKSVNQVLWLPVEDWCGQALIYRKRRYYGLQLSRLYILQQ